MQFGCKIIASGGANLISLEYATIRKQHSALL